MRQECSQVLFLYVSLTRINGTGMFSGSFSICLTYSYKWDRNVFRFFFYVSLTRINGTGMFSGSFSICLTYSYKWDRDVLRFFFYMSHLLV